MQHLLSAYCFLIQCSITTRYILLTISFLLITFALSSKMNCFQISVTHVLVMKPNNNSKHVVRATIKAAWTWVLWLNLGTPEKLAFSVHSAHSYHSMSAEATELCVQHITMNQHKIPTGYYQIQLPTTVGPLKLHTQMQQHPQPQHPLNEAPTAVQDVCEEKQLQTSLDNISLSSIKSLHSSMISNN